MADQAYEPRLKSEYRNRIRGVMKEQFAYSNEMQIPKLDKIVLNMGIGEAVADSKKVQSALADLAKIAGQKPVATKARTSSRSPWLAAQVRATTASVSAWFFFRLGSRLAVPPRPVTSESNT